MTCSIDDFRFEFWDGPAPPVPTRKLVALHQPGVSGVAHQMLGTWADTFSVVLTSHHASFQDAAIQYSLLKNIIGSVTYLVYEGIPWSAMFGTVYTVEAIELVQLRSAILLAGPGYSYSDGASLVTRFTLTPQAT